MLAAIRQAQLRASRLLSEPFPIIGSPPIWFQNGIYEIGLAAEAREYTTVLIVLHWLAPRIEKFIDENQINCPDEATRSFNLGILSGFVAACLKLADFTKLVPETKPD